MNKRAGISYHELAAVALPPPPFDSLTYSVTNKHTCYLYAFQSALQHLYKVRGQEIVFTNPSAMEKEVFFQDIDLNGHFYKFFDSLANDRQQQLPGVLSPYDTSWTMAIANGIALINVWDIGMNKAVYHFLPALRGHLDNSYLWLFLDLDRDFNKLNSTPDLPDDKTRKEKDFIMQYRSRMDYLLRPAMLAKSISSSDREDVCSVFVSHSSKYEKHQLDSLVKDVQIVSTQANLSTVVNTKEVTPINPEDANCWKVLKTKFDEIVSERLESTMPISLASIFLRSLYYGVDKMYITKRELKATADLLNISNADFKEFCKVFTSLGSIIDINLIDQKSDYVILRPIDFVVSTKSFILV